MTFDKVVQIRKVGKPRAATPRATRRRVRLPFVRLWSAQWLGRCGGGKTDIRRPPDACFEPGASRPMVVEECIGPAALARSSSSDRMPELVPTAADLRVLAKTGFDALFGNPHLRLSEAHHGQLVAARNVLITDGREASS